MSKMLLLLVMLLPMLSVLVLLLLLLLLLLLVQLFFAVIDAAVVIVVDAAAVLLILPLLLLPKLLLKLLLQLPLLLLFQALSSKEAAWTPRLGCGVNRIWWRGGMALAFLANTLNSRPMAQLTPSAGSLPKHWHATVCSHSTPLESDSHELQQPRAPSLSLFSLLA